MIVVLTAGIAYSSLTLRGIYNELKTRNEIQPIKPTPPARCVIDRNLDFKLAVQYMKNYKKAPIDRSRFSGENNYPRGCNIHACVKQGWEICQKKFAYQGMSGVRMMFGLRNSDDNLDNERVAILLPLDNAGKLMPIDTSLINFSPGVTHRRSDMTVVMIGLPSGFQDPCPDLCD